MALKNSTCQLAAFLSVTTPGFHDVASIAAYAGLTLTGTRKLDGPKLLRIFWTLLRTLSVICH